MFADVLMPIVVTTAAAVPPLAIASWSFIRLSRRVYRAQDAYLEAVRTATRNSYAPRPGRSWRGLAGFLRRMSRDHSMATSRVDPELETLRHAARRAEMDRLWGALAALLVGAGMEFLIAQSISAWPGRW